MQRFTGIILCFLFLQGASHASNWVEVGSDANGYKSYLDYESIAPIDGHSYHMWFKSVTPSVVSDTHNGIPTGYSLQCFKVDCSSRQIITTRIIIYSKDDKRIFDESPLTIKPLEPDSFADKISQTICPKLNTETWSNEDYTQAESQGRGVCIDTSGMSPEELNGLVNIMSKQSFKRSRQRDNCFIHSSP